MPNTSVGSSLFGSILSLFGLGTPTPVAVPDVWMMPSAFVDPVAEIRLGEITLMMGSGTQYPQPDHGVSIDRKETSKCASSLGTLRHHAKVHPRFGFVVEVDSSSVVNDAYCSVTLEPELLPLRHVDIEDYLKKEKDTQTLNAYLQTRQGKDGDDVLLRLTQISRAELSTQLSSQKSAVALEILAHKPEQIAKANGTVELLVLQDGKPLADQWVQIINSRGNKGWWKQSDAQGLVNFDLPTAEIWIFRTSVAQLATVIQGGSPMLQIDSTRSSLIIQSRAESAPSQL